MNQQIKFMKKIFKRKMSGLSFNPLVDWLSETDTKDKKLKDMIGYYIVGLDD